MQQTTSLLRCQLLSSRACAGKPRDCPVNVLRGHFRLPRLASVERTCLDLAEKASHLRQRASRLHPLARFRERIATDPETGVEDGLSQRDRRSVFGCLCVVWYPSTTIYVGFGVHWLDCLPLAPEIGPKAKLASPARSFPAYAMMPAKALALDGSTGATLACALGLCTTAKGFRDRAKPHAGKLAGVNQLEMPWVCHV